jgi:hypothetical protein
MDLHARSSGSDALQAAFWNWKIAQYTRMEAGEPYCPGKSEFFTMSVKANWEMRNRPMDSWGEFLECSGVAKERFRWAGARPARKPPETRRSEGFRQAFEALVLRNAKCEERSAKCRRGAWAWKESAGWTGQASHLAKAVASSTGSLEEQRASLSSAVGLGNGPLGSCAGHEAVDFALRHRWVHVIPVQRRRQ